MRGILAALLVSGTAFSGQLFVDEYGLKQVAAADGATVVVGKLVSSRKVGREQEIEVEVAQVFCKGAVSLKPGEHLRRKVYPGVEWTDPHKSPIEHRLRHKIDAGDGATVVVVPFEGFSSVEVELLPASPEVLRTLRILFDGSGYSAEPEARLVEDLANPDLAELARAVLKVRGRLTVAALAGADPRFLAEHFRGLSPAERVKFAAEAV